eukprot:gene24085-9659_t
MNMLNPSNHPIIPTTLGICVSLLNPSNHPGGANADDEPAEPLINCDNRAGRDFAAVNGVIQPAVNLTAGRYQRWQMINTFTKKWLDLTIRRKPTAAQNYTFGECEDVVDTCTMYLIGHDEILPRLTSSTNETMGQIDINNVVLGPANRADILVKCDKEGEYVLVSGAGPFDTAPSCTAVHCELFGGSVNREQSPRATGNNFYQGQLQQEYSAAILATISVGKRDAKEKKQHDLVPDAYRTRLELFEYTNMEPSDVGNQTQCYDLRNFNGGAGCTVNGVLFGRPDTVAGTNYFACMDQGTDQLWEEQDTRFHPNHMHETPVRIDGLPDGDGPSGPIYDCLSEDGPVYSNFYPRSDWVDDVTIPYCQCNATDPQFNGQSCDPVNVEFKASRFPPIPPDFFTDPMPSSDMNLFLKTEMDTYTKQLRDPLDMACEDRYSVFHCHILSHKDEGCMSVAYWKCPTQAPLGTCEENNFPVGDCSAGLPP